MQKRKGLGFNFSQKKSKKHENGEKKNRKTPVEREDFETFCIEPKGVLHCFRLNLVSKMTPKK